MKRLLASIAALACVLVSLQAQSSDNILASVRKAHDGGLPVSRRFVEVRSNKALNIKDRQFKGLLKFEKPDTFIMNYDNGEDFVIEGGKMTINRDGKVVQFDLAKNKLMAGLSHTLLYSFGGRLQDLATEQKSDIKAEKSGNGYLVTLTATKKLPKGYSRIEVLYSLKDYSVVTILMEEFGGARTLYSWE